MEPVLRQRPCCRLPDPTKYSKMKDPTMDHDLQEMLDHFRIRKVLAEYCRGSGRADEPLMASIYAADSWDDHGVVRAPGPEYSKLMCERVAETTESLSHLLGQ